MTLDKWVPENTLGVGIVCATGACAMGFVYLLMADAPLRYLGINAGALILGLLLLAALRFTPKQLLPVPGLVTLGLGLALLATALFGTSVEGASRWVQIGGLFIQISLLVVPWMTVSFAASQNRLSTAGLALAATALALQPDRAMAGALAIGLIVLFLVRPSRQVFLAAGIAILGFAVTLFRADLLPAMPYVDQIFYSSFDVHPLAGAALLAGAVLMLLPAIAGYLSGADHREVHVAFGAVWLTIIAAAALGNYPTPLIGFGGSAIIGYLVSLSALGRMPRHTGNVASTSALPSQGSNQSGQNLNRALA